MSEETTNQQSCGGKKRVMLPYGPVHISDNVVSTVSYLQCRWIVGLEAGEPHVQRLR